jgi:hypothetical protein
MLPNFTIVICGAILTVMMLAVTGSGLVTPETRTRIGEMPEIGRPMVQRMIPEQAAQAQFAALDLSRRAEEIGRLRDLAPPALVSEPAPAARDDELVREPAKTPHPNRSRPNIRTKPLRPSSRPRRRRPRLRSSWRQRLQHRRHPPRRHPHFLPLRRRTTAAKPPQTRRQPIRGTPQPSRSTP